MKFRPLCIDYHSRAQEIVNNERDSHARLAALSILPNPIRSRYHANADSGGERRRRRWPESCAPVEATHHSDYSNRLLRGDCSEDDADNDETVQTTEQFDQCGDNAPAEHAPKNKVSKLKYAEFCSLKHKIIVTIPTSFLISHANHDFQFESTLRQRKRQLLAQKRFALEFAIRRQLLPRIVTNNALNL